MTTKKQFRETRAYSASMLNRLVFYVEQNILHRFRRKTEESEALYIGKHFHSLMEKGLTYLSNFVTIDKREIPTIVKDNKGNEILMPSKERDILLKGGGFEVFVEKNSALAAMKRLLVLQEKKRLEGEEDFNLIDFIKENRENNKDAKSIYTSYVDFCEKYKNEIYYIQELKKSGKTVLDFEEYVKDPFSFFNDLKRWYQAVEDSKEITDITKSHMTVWRERPVVFEYKGKTMKSQIDYLGCNFADWQLSERQTLTLDYIDWKTTGSNPNSSVEEDILKYGYLREMSIFVEAIKSFIRKDLGLKIVPSKIRVNVYLGVVHKKYGTVQVIRISKDAIRKVKKTAFLSPFKDFYDSKGHYNPYMTNDQEKTIKSLNLVKNMDKFSYLGWENLIDISEKNDLLTQYYEGPKKQETETEFDTGLVEFSVPKEETFEETAGFDTGQTEFEIGQEEDNPFD